MSPGDPGLPADGDGLWENGPAGPLAGLRIIDMADERGAYATKLLADLGANVIRVLAPAAPPSVRPPVGGPSPIVIREWFFTTNKRPIRGMAVERLLWSTLATTEDRAEGRAAFREKRPPRFKGR